MNKTLLYIGLALLLIASGCKKDYTCYCILPEPYLSAPTPAKKDYRATIKDASKHYAKKQCEELENNLGLYECSLK